MGECNGEFSPVIELLSFGLCAKIVVRDVQQIGIGHDTVLDARPFAGNDEVVSDVRFGWTERAYGFPDTNAKRVCVQFTKLNACVLERFADVSRIQLEVG